MRKSVADWAWFLVSFICIISLCPFFVSYICCHSILFSYVYMKGVRKAWVLFSLMLISPSILTFHCYSQDSYKLSWLYSEWDPKANGTVLRLHFVVHSITSKNTAFGHIQVPSLSAYSLCPQNSTVALHLFLKKMNSGGKESKRKGCDFTGWLVAFVINVMLFKKYNSTSVFQEFQGKLFVFSIVIFEIKELPCSARLHSMK